MATTIAPPAEPTQPIPAIPPARRRRPRMTPAQWAVRAAVVTAAALALFLYVTSQQGFRSAILAQGIVFAVGALSLNVLIGYAGQISLGQQAFIGIGAFASAYVISQSHQSFYVALAVGALVGALQAVVLGLVALRVQGLYFALVTLAWGLVGENAIFRIRSFTGGGAGQEAPRPGGFQGDKQYLIICIVALAMILLADWRLVATKAGRAMQALRESPAVAANYGVNVKAYTLLAFGVSGVYAGVAGALFASKDTRVVSNNFSFQTVALPLLIITVVGGLRRRGGIVLFALLYVLGGEYLPDLAHFLGVKFIEDNKELIIQAVSGGLAIATLIFQPDGLGTITAPIGRWLKGESPHARA